MIILGLQLPKHILTFTRDGLKTDFLQRTEEFLRVDVLSALKNCSEGYDTIKRVSSRHLVETIAPPLTLSQQP